MREILLVYDLRDADVAAELESELTRAFGDKGDSVSVVHSHNSNNAKSLLPGDFSLVITFLHIRKKPGKEPLAEQDEEGLELLSWISLNEMNKPMLLIAPTRTPKLDVLEPNLRNFDVVLTGSTMIQKVVERALQAKEFSKLLDVEIRLRSMTDWGYRLVGHGFGFKREGNFAIEESDVEELSRASEYVGYVPNWREALQDVGAKLLNALDKDKEFKLRVALGLQQAGGEAHARVRFVVKPELHNLALEAVLCPDTHDHWMLYAPIFRFLLDQPSVGALLFEGGQRLECLIIEATASGLVADLGEKGMTLSRLKEVEKECEWLEKEINGQRSQFNIGNVLRLRREDGKPPLSQQVKEALESHEWGVVHFAGHSYYDTGSKNGYVFFPGAVPGSIEKVDVTRFAGWLRRATFTYFSSCDAGAGPFIFSLASQRVSNILGFRWEIKDLLGSAFAQEFYKHLFQTRSLEKAFLKARQQMYEQYPKDRIWAAPILIKQLSDS
jgi:hypothetical protein